MINTFGKLEPCWKCGSIPTIDVRPFKFEEKRILSDYIVQCPYCGNKVYCGQVTTIADDEGNWTHAPYEMDPVDEAVMVWNERVDKENKLERNTQYVDLRYGDCLESLKSLPDKSVDLVIIDPPYDIETSGAGIYKQDDKQYVKELNNMKDGFPAEVLDELCRVMKKTNLYIFCSQKQIIPLLNYFVTSRKEKDQCNWNLLSWHKTNPVPACGNKYLTDTEFILFFREKGVPLRGSYYTKKTWYATPLNQADKKKYHHPAVKPVDILKNLIINSSEENDIVLDCYMGSGSVGEACVETNRRFIGMEWDFEHYVTANERVKKLSFDKRTDELFSKK